VESNTSAHRTPGQAVVSVTVATSNRLHAIAHRAVLAARNVDDWWDTPLETALAITDLARHTHAHLGDADRALSRIRRWWNEGEPRRTSSDVTALALAARASAELQQREAGLLSAAVQGVDDLARRGPSIAPELHIALCAWALDPLVPDRDAAPWPAIRARLEHATEIRANEPLRCYANAIAQRSFNSAWLAEELVSQIGAAAGPSDSCILVWLITVSCEKMSLFLSKEDSALQVLFRRRSELTERLAGEIDDQTFREPEAPEFDPDDIDVARGSQIYLSSFEAVLLDFALASREPSHPWVTYEEAESLFGQQAERARAELDATRRRLLQLVTVLIAALSLAASVALWFALRSNHIDKSVANPAAVALASAGFMVATRSGVSVTNPTLFDALGIFFGTLMLLAAAVAVNQALRKPYISDVGGLVAGALIASGAVLLWALLKRRK